MSSRKRKKQPPQQPKPTVTVKPITQQPAQPKKEPVLSHRLSIELTKDRSPILRKNKNGDITYSMQYVGDEKYEYWIVYDDSRRPIKYIDSRGYTWSCTYNSKGNISTYWDNSGYSEVYRYYANGLVICTNSYGVKTKKKITRDERLKFISRNSFIIANDYILSK